MRQVVFMRFGEEVLDFVSVGENANDRPDSRHVKDLVVPKEKVRRAPLRRALEPAVDVFHQKIPLQYIKQ